MALAKRNEGAKIKNPPDFSQMYSIQPQFDNLSKMLTISVNLNDGLHAYATGEKIGRPVRFLVEEKNGWQADGPAEIPPGEKKSLSGLGDTVVLQGNFAVKQKLKPGANHGQGLLYLQVCTIDMCDQPRSHKVQW